MAVRKRERFGWGIYLPLVGKWAELPPRMRKPTRFNSDLTPAMLDLARTLDKQGQAVEIKRIRPAELAEMKADR
ncbi:MAG: hypothetical protein AAGH88_05540 [Planctomycetota bacterium]